MKVCMLGQGENGGVRLQKDTPRLFSLKGSAHIGWNISPLDIFI
jgi:hypothetical protein